MPAKIRSWIMLLTSLTGMLAGVEFLQGCSCCVFEGLLLNKDNLHPENPENGGYDWISFHLGCFEFVPPSTQKGDCKKDTVPVFGLEVLEIQICPASSGT